MVRGGGPGKDQGPRTWLPAGARAHEKQCQGEVFAMRKPTMEVRTGEREFAVIGFIELYTCTMCVLITRSQCQCVRVYYRGDAAVWCALACLFEMGWQGRDERW